MIPAWIHKIKKGDVLKSGSGKLRVVRDVSHNQVKHYALRTSVTFAIMHCSWTERPYTTYTGQDLVNMKYRPTRAKVTLRKKIDKAIERVMYARDGRSALPDYGAKKPYEVTCCDVEGIA